MEDLVNCCYLLRISELYFVNAFYLKGFDDSWGTWGSGNGTWGTWGTGNGTGTWGTWGSGNGTWGSGNGTWGSGNGTWGSNGGCNQNWIADSICDDINNNLACSYDGGDCCESTNINGAVNTL